jgi:plastocyanin
VGVVLPHGSGALRLPDSYVTAMRLVVLALLGLAACSSGGSTTAPGSGGSPAVLASLGLSAPGNTLAIGGTMQLTASPKDQNGSPYSATLTWTSGSNFVATMSASGLVTGIAGGQAYMYVRSGTISDSTLITVVTGAYPSSAIVNALPSSFSPVQSDIALGGTIQFVFPSTAHNVIFNPANGVPADIPGEVSNQTVPRTFGVRGSFVYNCTIHPGMTGTIVVH